MLPRMNQLILTVAAVFVFGATCPTNPQCPLHLNSGVTLSKTDYVSGKQVNTYKCSMGHTFSLVC